MNSKTSKKRIFLQYAILITNEHHKTDITYSTYNINICGVIKTLLNHCAQLRKLFYGKQYWSSYNALQKFVMVTHKVDKVSTSYYIRKYDPVINSCTQIKHLAVMERKLKSSLRQYNNKEASCKTSVR